MEKNTIAAKVGANRRRANFVKAACLSGCALAVGVGGVLAYFTATDAETNEFTLAQALKIDVQEPSWDPDNGKNILPGQTVAKDPKIVNESDMDAYAVMRVTIPHKTVNVVAADGSSESVSTDLFAYELAHADDWELQSSKASEDGTRMINTYYYKHTLPARGETTTLFDEVTFANLVESQELGDLSIVVDGYAIQTEGFNSVEDAWSAYQAQNEI